MSPACSALPPAPRGSLSHTRRTEQVEVNQPKSRLSRLATADAGPAIESGMRVQLIPNSLEVASTSEIQMGFVTPGAIAAGTLQSQSSPVGRRRPYVSVGNPGA